jgi:hypothetical protein
LGKDYIDEIGLIVGEFKKIPRNLAVNGHAP